MKNKIFRNIKSFSKDNLCLIFSVTNTLLAATMWLSPQEHGFYFWFTLAFRLLTPVVALVFGRGGLWVLYFIFCNIKALDPSYNNIVIIGIISVLFLLLPKINKNLIVIISLIYITDIFTVAELYHKSGFYIYSTFLLCAQYITAVWEHKRKGSGKIMILTPDEIEILNQLKDSNIKKQIEGYSETTIYRKLTEARNRNNYETNDELLGDFKKSLKVV